MQRRLWITLTVGLAFLLTVAACGRLLAERPGAGSTSSVEGNPDEGWSFDDVKDVFEAIHFFAITVGIGVGVWWFSNRYLRQGEALSLELDVGSRSSAGQADVLELVARIRNDGVNGARIRRCSFQVSIIDAAQAAREPGVLLEGAGQKPLFDGDFIPNGTSIPPGACQQFTTVVSVPPDQQACLFTARVESGDGSQVVVCSRLLCRGTAPD